MNHQLTIGQVINIMKGHSKYSHNREFMHRFIVIQQKEQKELRQLKPGLILRSNYENNRRS